MSSLTDRLRRRRARDAGSSASTTPRPAAVTTPGHGSRSTVRDWRDWGPVALLRAAQPRQALLVTGAVTAAAAMAGRTTREVALVAGTVLVGQVLLGWHNDLADADRDARHGRNGKPLVAGTLDRGTLVFAVACVILLVVPLSIANGVVAGMAHLAILGVAVATNAGLLRRTRLSWLPWAAAFALWPAFLSYGGWAREADGAPPTIAMTVLVGLLGVCVHVLRSLPGLVDDNADGWRTFPLWIALRIGAPKLMLVGAAAAALVTAGVLVVAVTVGLAQ